MISDMFILRNYTNPTVFFLDLATNEDMQANNIAQQGFPYVSGFSPRVVWYLSSGERELQFPWG